MNHELYPMIFKRKSFHLFKNVGHFPLTIQQLNDILEAFNSFEPLIEGIRVELVIEKKSTLAIGQEYCLMLYSEIKEGYLQNIGYLGEQLDLYCVSKNIGTLWFGLGKTEQKKYHGLDYVIMIAIKNVDYETKFRKDMFQSRRKSLEEIWHGEAYQPIGNIVRFAPSAVNSQPWLAKVKANEISVYRLKKQGIVGSVMISKMDFFNQIDIGIFLCFLDLCLAHHQISYSKEIHKEDESGLNAVYILVK